MAYICLRQRGLPMTTSGVTYAQTRQITWVPYAQGKTGAISAPMKSKVRWGYEEGADFSPPIEAASTTSSTSPIQTDDYAYCSHLIYLND